jgi:hypothetical protein
MGTNMCSCKHLERNSLNIYLTEMYFGQNLQKEL